MRYAIRLLVFAVAGCISCSKPVGDGPIPQQSEVVMSPGMRIIATTAKGTIEIQAGLGLKRAYTWEGATRAVEMWPRKKRWNGSLGLYHPGPGRHWRTHNGVNRGVVEEGIQSFLTEEEAIQWVKERNARLFFVYADDGLCVGWCTVPSREALHVEVWQLLIGGKKPLALRGASSQKIDVVTPRED